MAIGAAVLLIIQFFVALIPYINTEVNGVQITQSIFLDQPAIMVLAFAILAVAIIANFKEQFKPFALGASVLYSVYFIVKPIVTMAGLKAASFAPVTVIIFSVAALVVSIIGIAKIDE